MLLKILSIIIFLETIALAVILDQFLPIVIPVLCIGIALFVVYKAFSNED